ncbi:cation:proton antiporter [Rathayibacter tritici]|uniref:Potassium transporter n=1 Tax=Rathayibacter tritici TaxID=33888 RepID=A0A160KQL9_9MICO|nr:cation:proton antiporter [Rathayibacter tritici]AND15812.1 potassium transporter [Rathayibacter tritici]PPF24908.1 cation:proton antiporter [Rathayibacter tritici]PPF63524.1 cation:proton antiporter [Rathayibacter tritici]PPG04158.1 cation:proton antiporter [Rathayibacter tritici]PPI15841.1 cation:proton antiporter [Rathayibacter tritici]
MHHGEDLIVLGLLFVVAYVLGRLGRTIGLPAIPIYMVVGLLASPNFHLFPLDFESSYIELTAVFGLILLLFTLGLEFDQDEFFGNAGRLILSGGSYIAVNMAVGLGFGFALGWGSREALVIAGITATSSSAIVTKLLIELKRLANPETPMILGVTVVEDIFIAVYLAIVSVVLSGETEPWPVVLKLFIAFAFLVVMFSVARWGGKVVSRVFRTRDDELFTILFFGLALLFGGIGEVLGVTDAIGAFLIGLVIGATRFRSRVEHIAIPLRDVFGAFFFVNFGLGLDPGAFPSVVVPVLIAAVMTIVLNLGAGQFVAWLNKLGPRAGLNAAFILHNRGEFALILATLSLSAGLDERIQPFAGLYVLIMAIVGPILASRSESIGALLSRRRHRAAPAATSAMDDEDFALVEAAMAAPAVAAAEEASAAPRRPAEPDELDDEFPDPMRQALIDQAMQQSDGADDSRPRRPREPDY